MGQNSHRIKIVVGLCAGTIFLNACSSGSSGSSTSSTSITTYASFTCPGTNNVSFPGVSGIRQVVNSSSNVYVTGVYVQYGATHGFLYKGPVLGGGGICSQFNYPSSPGANVTSTSPYGPNDNGDGTVTVVGSYTIGEHSETQLGFMYRGADDGSNTNGYITLLPPSPDSSPVINTIGHSTMGDIVVGDYDTVLATGKSFIYNIKNKTYYNLTAPGGSASITAYGVWWNGGTRYTIAGGYSDVLESGVNIGFITDWDSETQQISNFTTLNYDHLPGSKAGTHFEGITTDGSNGYNLAADWNYTNQTQTSPAFAHITRRADNSFGIAAWTTFAYYPGSSWTSANTIYKNYILGLFQMGTPVKDYGYVATVAVN